MTQDPTQNQKKQNSAIRDRLRLEKQLGLLWYFVSLLFTPTYPHLVMLIFIFSLTYFNSKEHSVAIFAGSSISASPQEGRQTFGYSSLVFYLYLLSPVSGFTSQLSPLLLSLQYTLPLLFPASAIIAITPCSESIVFFVDIFLCFSLLLMPKITNTLVHTLFSVTFYFLKRLGYKGRKQ